MAIDQVRLRTDGRYEVADTREGNEGFGCNRDDWCVLIDGHVGECEEDREVWAGPDQPYARLHGREA